MCEARFCRMSHGHECPLVSALEEPLSRVGPKAQENNRFQDVSEIQGVAQFLGGI